MTYARRSCLTITRLFALMLLTLVVGGVSSQPLLAAPEATFTPNATFDAADANPGDGICAVSAALGGACTLRAAIQEANLNAGADTINLPAGVYLLTVNGMDNPPSAAQAGVGDLDISDSAGLTINGTGVTIIGQINVTQFSPSGDGLFSVRLGASATINGVTIKNSGRAYNNEGQLTLTNGVIRDGITLATISPGGAIFNSGTLVLTNYTIDNVSGSAIFSSPLSTTTQATLTNVSIRNTNGPAFFAGGTWQISNSTFDGNETGMFFSSAQNVTISNSTISNNTPFGGIDISGSSNAGTITIRNTTISGNVGSNKPGGLKVAALGTQVNLNNVTITNNQSGSTGGGIEIASTDVFIKNSILAGNNGGNGRPDCFALASRPLHSQGFNLIGDTANCAIDGATTGNITGQSPQLEPLQNNGGSTQTHAPLSGSPVVNAGSNAAPGSGGTACEAQDQIGTNRPQGGRCDMGAFEGATGVATPPSISSISPNTAAALGPAFTLTVNGANFQNASVVRWQGANRTTTFGSAAQVTAAIPATDLAAGGIVPVTVFDPVQGRTSNSVNFTVNNPLPTVTDSDPKTVRAGTRGLRVSIFGTNFTPTSEVLMDGTPVPTLFVSNTKVQAKIPSSAMTTAGQQLTLRVRNPAPGGGTSAAFVTLSVTSALPPFNVGEGEFSADIQAADLQSTLVLTWTHPTDWRLLNEMDVRLVDENGDAALWLGFDEDFGSKGALLLRDADGLTAGLAVPGDAVLLGNQIANLDVANSVINGDPGTTVAVIYAIKFQPAAGGKTYDVELYASDENGESHGFEPFGSVTVPIAVYLPTVIR